MQFVDFLDSKKLTSIAHKKVTKNSSDSFDADLTQETGQTDEAIFADFIQRGNIAALGEIYDRYGLLVYRLVYKMLNNCQEAEDLTQEIFLRLQERPRFNPQRGSFYTYLMMSARSQAIDRLRSQRSQGQFWQNTSKMKDLISKQNSTDLIEYVSLEERANRVKNALAMLSKNQRQILELAYYEGLSQSEIAKRLNLPLGTVKTHSRRGLIKLKQNLHNLVRKT